MLVLSACSSEKSESKNGKSESKKSGKTDILDALPKGLEEKVEEHGPEKSLYISGHVLLLAKNDAGEYYSVTLADKSPDETPGQFSITPSYGPNGLESCSVVLETDVIEIASRSKTADELCPLISGLNVSTQELAESLGTVVATLGQSPVPGNRAYPLSMKTKYNNFAYGKKGKVDPAIQVYVADYPREDGLFEVLNWWYEGGENSKVIKGARHYTYPDSYYVASGNKGTPPNFSLTIWTEKDTVKLVSVLGISKSEEKKLLEFLK